MFRHHQFDGITSDISPIHWQDGAVARLKPGDPIEKYLHNSYSTISLGYIGLYELTKLVKGVSHTDKKVGTKFALKVINHLKDKTVEWKEKTNVGFSLYGTPAENLCYVFAKHDKEVFGEIDDITDKGYYTNSYHVDVREDIDALDKLKFEEQFQKVSLGGCISYVEVPCMTKNTEALRAIVKWGYNHIQYFEFNSKLDYCNSCGFEGEIDLIQDEGTKEFHFKCPNCGETDQNNMHIVRRTCGYLGKSRWNQGKLSEFKNRFVHVGESEIIK